MITFFILLLGIGHNHAASMTPNSTGLLDEQGVCHCSVVLPDSTFPADRFEMLQISNHNLTSSVEKQISKIHHYESTLIIYMERLMNLTKRVEVMEMGGTSDTESDFEMVKMEIREIEALILQMKTSMNGSNVLVEDLYEEIRNLSITVNQMEVYDKNNDLVIRREIAALKTRFEVCEKNQTNSMPKPPVDRGTCQNGFITSISKPFSIQLNYMGISYKYGGWGSDSLAGADHNIHWVAPLSIDARGMRYLRVYKTYNDLLSYEHIIDQNQRTFGQGGGMIMFNKTMYFNCYNNGNICKYNPQLNTIELSVNLPNAVSNNRFSYSSTPYQDIDMAGDEEGLWAIYSTVGNYGKFVISKINPLTLEVNQTWTTAQYKSAATNAFMACGVLYATRTISTKKEEIFYMYDTKSNKEGWLSVPFEKPKENVQSLAYNPNDRKLYMYNDGFLINYDIYFTSPQEGKSQI